MAIASSSRPTRRRAPTRRPRHRYKPIDLGKKRWIVRAFLGWPFWLVVILVGWAVDGAPARAHGEYQPRSFRRDSCARLLRPTRTATRRPRRWRASQKRCGNTNAALLRVCSLPVERRTTRFVEADVMAGAAAAQGIPPSAIFVETKAHDTIQNACYSARIMQAHGWHSAEIVSSAYHLPRAG